MREARGLLALLLSAPCAVGFAAGFSTVDRTDMTVALHRYYDAEALPLPYLLFSSLLALLVAALLAKRSNRFWKGFAAALATISAVIGVSSFAYLLQVDDTHATAAAMLAHDPVRYQQIEAEHLADMLQGFSTVMATDIACAAIGAAMLAYGAITAKRFLKGVGVGLLLCGLLLVALENHHRYRALDYLDVVRAFRPQLPSLPSIDRGVRRPSQTI